MFKHAASAFLIVLVLLASAPHASAQSVTSLERQIRELQEQVADLIVRLDRLQGTETRGSGTSTLFTSGSSGIDSYCAKVAADPLSGSGYYGSATEAEVKRLMAQTGVNLAARLTAIDSPIASICGTSRESNAGGTPFGSTKPSTSTTGTGTVPGTVTTPTTTVAPVTPVTPTTPIIAPVETDATLEEITEEPPTTSRRDYYDSEGRYHSGATYNAVRDDDPAVTKIPGSQLAYNLCTYRGEIRFCQVTFYDPDGIRLSTVNFKALDLVKEMDHYGIPLTELHSLGSALAARGIGYLPGQRPWNYEDGGINLEDLISGGLGTVDDWRINRHCELVEARFRHYCDQAVRDRAEADRLGMKPNLAVTTGLTYEQWVRSCNEVEARLTMEQKDSLRDLLKTSAYIREHSNFTCPWQVAPMGSR